MVDGHDRLAESQRESGGSGLYVDMENMRGDGQTVIESLVRDWPAKIPAMSRLSLYVRADQVELWRLWATSRFEDVKVVVKGTQHFSMSPTKNSSDISIAVNAMADLLLRRISHVVVLSDDSDFISLYAAIRDEPEIESLIGNVPFLWVVTDRESSLSATVKQFFPPEKMHVVSTKATAGTVAPKAVLKEPAKSIWGEMAVAVVEAIPVGPFKSTDCKSIIAQRWPSHSMANAESAAFGTDFKNNIWPSLERMGVEIGNPGNKPIKYEMTPKAKDELS